MLCEVQKIISTPLDKYSKLLCTHITLIIIMLTTYLLPCTYRNGVKEFGFPFQFLGVNQGVLEGETIFSSSYLLISYLILDFIIIWFLVGLALKLVYYLKTNAEGRTNQENRGKDESERIE